jgi:Flp pilus assembly protein TadD
VRTAKGDVEGALEDFNEALRIKPDDAAVVHHRSLARRAMGDEEGAQKDQNESLRLGYKPKK